VDKLYFNDRQFKPFCDTIPGRGGQTDDRQTEEHTDNFSTFRQQTPRLHSITRIKRLLRSVVTQSYDEFEVCSVI